VQQIASRSVNEVNAKVVKVKEIQWPTFESIFKAKPAATAAATWSFNLEGSANFVSTRIKWINFRVGRTMSEISSTSEAVEIGKDLCVE